MSSNYQLNRFNGKVLSVTRMEDGATFPISSDNALAREFIEWNEKQPVPFDLRDQEPQAATAAELRKAEYEKQGVTVEALTVALWEKMVEGRSAAADELQRKRDAIKEQFPAQAAQTVKG